MERQPIVVTRRILVVEDSRTQAERLRHLLAQQGYEVEMAANGREGLEAAKGRPDLIISDVTMPEMDGFALCRAVKSAPETKRIPFILLTARSTPADIVRGLECGADNFIPKLSGDGYLLERISRIVEQLDLRSGERLEMEVILTIGDKKITVTADRQQIMELLFSTLEQLSDANDVLQHINHELEQARAEADQANRRKSEFLSRTSHELRTPMNAILGFAQLLEGEDLTDEQTQSVTQILTAGWHLIELINEMLDLGRIESGQLSLDLLATPTHEVIEEVVHLFEPLAEPSKIRFRLDVRNGTVLADRKRLKQILINLISNAVKYNRPGGSVVVTAGPLGQDRFRISVADTGQGIPSDSMQKLFEPFERLGVQESFIQGAGLGLSVTKRLVEAMDGTIEIESRLGEGSVFIVVLPRVEEPPEREVPEQDPHGAVVHATRGTVLCIEDNPSNLLLLERALLRRPGVRLVSATEGRRGVSIATDLAPDLIVMDLDLPDIDGEEALSLLLGDARTREIPVVVVTADATSERMQRLLASGAREYLTKPLDVRRFLAVVDDAARSPFRVDP
jgi:signal transduction histidine kinase